MEQLKEFLGVLKRQHFWLIAPLLFLIGIVGWMSATKQLSKQFNENSSTVNGYVATMKTVLSRQPHPNTSYHDGMAELIESRRTNIRAAWKKKWDRQKTELTWPEELPEDFRSMVEEMRPIETQTKAIPARSRRYYKNFVADALPKLAEQVGAVWAPAKTGGFSRFAPRSGENNNDTEGPVAIVNWSSNDQGEWSKRFDWGDAAPTTKEVLYAQEDLWVLSTLIDIIKRTNGDAVTNSQAKVKSIEFINIGKNVAPPSRQAFRVTMLQPFEPDDAGEDGEAEDTLPPPSNEPLPGGDFRPGEGGAPVAAASEVVKNRYYDANYEQIASEQDLLDYVTVAKRVPVRMKLEIDQRALFALLTECANAPLTFEVRQCRFNPQEVGYGGRELGNTFGGRNTSAKRLSDYQSFNRTVELFGIVYIFNPVNDALLNGEVSIGSRGGGEEEE